MAEETPEQSKRRKIFSRVILIAAGIALVVTLLTSYYQRKAAECQSDVNAQFLSVQKERAAINDGDRDSVRTLFETLVNNADKVEKGKMTPAQSQASNTAAIQAYFKKQNDLDQQRRDHPLPDIVKCGDDNPLKTNTKG